MMPPTRLRRITVDLTPVQPGGDNGGAKLVAQSLVRELAKLAPTTEFVLFTTTTSHVDLAGLDAGNVRRECVDADLGAVPAAPGEAGLLGAARSGARVLVDTLVPAGERTRVKDAVWTLVKRQRRSQVSSALPADVHFCPFTAPFFFDPGVPLVALVHDLQFVEYPQFFDEQQRRNRQRDFVEACRRAERVVCVSEFVRQTVLANSQLPPDHVDTIHSTVVHATHADPDVEVIGRKVLASAGISANRFLLYPANVWPHKNHRRLVDGFAAYLHRVPTADLALLCTGAPGAAADEITGIGNALLPAGRFGFAGFLPEREFAAALRSCRAVIYPSLYEGFGLPLLEAMACDRPVLCSNTTSLPEVAGDAAILFDPLDVSAVATAIERLETEPELESQLVSRGRERVVQFGSARDMAARYLDVFERAVYAR
ncbi:MAG: glycosyltransferase family 4 protein [Chloroflexota bacterium]|nr:glycosyltransferase family 4 protein [Chloroflexota bacterium]